MYQHGDSVGIVGDTCTGEASYTGTQDICFDGEVVNQDYNGGCYSGFKCCQSGEPGTWNAAKCIDDTSDCNEWVDPSYVYKSFIKQLNTSINYFLIIRTAFKN